MWRKTGRTIAIQVHLDEDAALFGAEAVGLGPDAEGVPVCDAARLLGEVEVEKPLGAGVDAAAAAFGRVYHGTTGPEYVDVKVEAPPGP
jgi:hypothetical protein